MSTLSLVFAASALMRLEKMTDKDKQQLAHSEIIFVTITTTMLANGYSVSTIMASLLTTFYSIAMQAPTEESQQDILDSLTELTVKLTEYYNREKK